MTRRLAVTVYLTPDVYARLKYEADQAGTPVSELMAGYLEGYAVRFPLPPAPSPVRRSLAQVRAEARARNGGVSPYTEQLQIIQQARTREGS